MNPTLSTAKLGEGKIAVFNGNNENIPLRESVTIPYHENFPNGFSVDGILYLLNPIEDSYTTGEVKYLGNTVLTYHLDKNRLDMQSTVIYVAQFKIRLNFQAGNIEYMRCGWRNGTYFPPRYDCPDDWIVLRHWDRP